MAKASGYIGRGANVSSAKAVKLSALADSFFKEKGMTLTGKTIRKYGKRQAVEFKAMTAGGAIKTYSAKQLSRMVKGSSTLKAYNAAMRQAKSSKSSSDGE